MRLPINTARLLLLLSAAIGTLFGGINGVAAAAIDGVRCPNGFETQFDATQKTMRCERTTALNRPTVCDPASAAHVVYRATKGRDFCTTTVDAVLPINALAASDSRRRAVTCGNESNDGANWQIEVDANGERDRCRATRAEWIYPSQQ